MTEHQHKMNEYAVFGDAIATFGIEAQVTMCIEEMAELTKEFCKRSRGADNRANIVEEITDVQIMLDQMKLLFDPTSEEPHIRKEKMDNLISLIRERREEIESARRAERRLYK